MSSEITKHPDLIKKEGIIKDLQKQLKKKQTTLKSLKTRLKNMQNDVEEISRKVQNTMMRKIEEIDALREEIAKYAAMMKKSKNISKEDKKALGEMAADFTENEDMFGEGYAQYKEHKAQMESEDFDFDAEQRARMRDIFQQFQVKPPEKEQRDIRKIFLKLSQKFHPDLAKNKKEEAEFHKMMQQINDAYQRNDIHTLLQLQREYLMETFDFNSNSITIDVLDKEIERLERELQFIENQINRISSEVKNLRQSDMGVMLTEVGKAERAGEGFEEMAAEHDKMIAIFTQLRDALKHSVEIDGVSPKMIEMMMGGGLGGSLMHDMQDEDEMAEIQEMMNQMMGNETPPNPEELMELLSKMAAHSQGDDEDEDFLSELFGMEDEEYEENENPKFPIGSSVRVKSNRPSDVDEKTKMKGWEGRISAAYFDEDEQKAYMVSFDSETIKLMSDKLVQRAIDFGEDFHEHPFLEAELVPAQPRDKKVAALAAYRKRFHNYNWEEFPKAQATRLKKILLNNVSLSDGQNWENYLTTRLKFPFAAKTRGIYSLEGIPEGLDCKVYGFEYFDETNGFIMSIKPQGVKQKVPHPLVDLEVMKNDKKMKEVVADYCEWGEEVLEF